MTTDDEIAHPAHYTLVNLKKAAWYINREIERRSRGVPGP